MYVRTELGYILQAYVEAETVSEATMDCFSSEEHDVDLVVKLRWRDDRARML
jgi:hypothetical protein